MLTYTPGGYMIAARIYTPGGYTCTRNTDIKPKGEFAYGYEEMPALQ